MKLTVLATLLGLVSLMNPAVAAAQYTDLYNFGGFRSDPINPGNPGAIAQGRNGNLYSTAPMGGSLGYGGIFAFSPEGNRLGVYSFDQTHGSEPRGGLILATDGNFYGTTSSGGSNNQGTIFRLSPDGGLTVIYSFSGTNSNVVPWASPIQGSDGSLYGTTLGTIYKITTSGQLTTLHTLTESEGSSVEAPLIEGTDGNFYGTAVSGGTSNFGTVFRITPKGIFTSLYSFDGIHGVNPYSALIQASDGNFYGTTAEGGSYGNGVVFQINSRGKLSGVISFERGSTGADSMAGLVQATDGNLYGATYAGGPDDNGVIFEVNPTGELIVLYEFEGFLGGALVPLIQHTNGVLYGDTYFGPLGHNDGTFYSYDLGLGPFIRLVSGSGKVGQNGQILGQAFNGTSSVSFNGIPAPFTVVSDTFLTATIPAGATTGYVTVTTPNGTLTSNKPFVVIP